MFAFIFGIAVGVVGYPIIKVLLEKLLNKVSK